MNFAHLVNVIDVTKTLKNVCTENQNVPKHWDKCISFMGFSVAKLQMGVVAYGIEMLMVV